MRDKLRKLGAFFKDWRNQSRYFRWMMEKTKPFLGQLSMLLTFDIVTALLGVGTTIVNKNVIDNATSGLGYRTGLLLLVGLTLFGIGLSAVIGILSTLVHERFTFSIRNKVFDHVLRSEYYPLSSFHSGDLMTRLTSDIDSVSNGISSILPGLVLLLVRLTAAFFVLFYYDRSLALIALMLGPVGALLSLIFSGKLKESEQALRDSESRYRSFMTETLSNLSAVKTFQREDASNERLLTLRNERLALTLKRNKMGALMNVCMRSVFSAGYLIAFAMGIYRLSTSAITFGTMTVFLSLVSQVQSPIMGLAQTIPRMISILTCTGRVMEMNDIPKEARSGETQMPSAVGVRLSDVTFAYKEEPVLRDVSLDIRPGDIVGVVGQSGSGKTTLIRLMLALIHPSKGRVAFYSPGGKEELADASSRRLLSYVPQEKSLLSGSIAENLRIGRESATEAEMWAALEIADAAGFVREQAEGLDEVLKEKAGGLSEGQAQRIAIARALIKAAPMLILDEATSALDAETEANVLERMRRSGRMQTCIVITHRRSMLKYCTRAIEVRDHRIHEIDIPDGEES